MKDLKVHTLLHSHGAFGDHEGWDEEGKTIALEEWFSLEDQHLHVVVWEPRPKPLPTAMEALRDYLEYWDNREGGSLVLSKPYKTMRKAYQQERKNSQ